MLLAAAQVSRMDGQGEGPCRSGSESMPGFQSPSNGITEKQAETYERHVKQAKHEAKLGNLAKSIELFTLANEIHSSEKLKSRIKKLEEALAVVALDEDNVGDDEFVDVLNSGLLLYKELYCKLFEHQKEGIAFLYGLFREKRKGGLLADDMGLGKTIQIIAFLSGMFDADLVKFVLLVMPTTLISNWMKEFVKWTPGMRVSEFHGTSKNERTRNLEKVQRKGGIVITTYQMLINNWEQISNFNGREFMWDYMILDEAHKIKTSSTKTSKCAHNIPAKYRILLTGTPVQNNLREMWALFDFACKGTLLGTSKTFKMEYENPITRAREKDATPGEKALGLKISENLMNIIKPYFLRRTKEDIEKNRVSAHEKNGDAPCVNSMKINREILETPEMPSLSRKNDLIVWVYLGTVQEEIYRKFISLEEIKTLLMSTKSPLAELNVLKKLCDHPRLLSARACSRLGLEGEDAEQYYDDTQTGHTGPTKIDHLSDESLIQESGKLVFLMELLERLQEEGHRTLVFSQSRKMLDIIDRILKNRSFKFMRIDGTVTHIAERERRITLFQNNNDYSVFLLTTQVGGVGITLTAADRVVIFDPSWNPATDAQAVDRAYRIGQTENVVIYRLITCGTVEEKIYRRQVFKDSLIRQTTGDKKNPFRYFSKQELRELFSLEDARTSTTQIQLQSMHSAQRKTDTELDEHIAYLHSLDIFGISDHDLMYSHEISAHEDQEGNEEEYNYIQHRVQKAQELVTLESNLHDQMKSGTRETWLKQPESGLETKAKRVPGAEPKNKAKPDFTVRTSIDLTLDDDVINVSARMTSLNIENSDEEMLEENISESDVCVAEDCQIVEKQREVSNSGLVLPLASNLFQTDGPPFETSVDVSNEKHGLISQTGTSLDKYTPCIESVPQSEYNGSVFLDKIQTLPNENKRQTSSSEQIHITREHKPMETSLFEVRTISSASKTPVALEAGKGDTSRLSGSKKLSEGIFKSFEGAGQHNLFSTTDSDALAPILGSRVSFEGMFKSPGDLKPSRDVCIEGDSLASQSPFESNFNLLLEASFEDDQSARENACEYTEEHTPLNLLVESSLADSANNSFAESKVHGNLNENEVVETSLSVSENNSFVKDKGHDNSNQNKMFQQNLVDSNLKMESADDSDIEDLFVSKRRVQKIDSDTEDENGCVATFSDNVNKKRRVKVIESESEDESGDIFAFDNGNDKKRKVQNIDSESEKDSVFALVNLTEKAISPFDSPLHSSFKSINSSTPKHNRSTLKSLHPPRKSFGLNTSTASRRSLVHIAVEELDDLDETVAGNEVEEEEMDDADDMVEEECRKESVDPEQKPVGEVLPLVNGINSHLEDDTIRFGLKSSSEMVGVEDTSEELSEGGADESTEDYTQEESTGDGELVSGEQIDCFAPDNGIAPDNGMYQVDIAHSDQNSKIEPVPGNRLTSTTSSYDNLVKLGKELKDSGKLKESLNCLLKALDIKSGDPELMLLTLSLYRQLSQC